MSEDAERGPVIIEAHQDLIAHVEKGSARMRVLSLLTIAVAGILAVAYASQLLLPLAGTTTVTVNLDDPANIASELLVLALALAWLYVGAVDLRFSWKMKAGITEARSKEREIQDRIS